MKYKKYIKNIGFIVVAIVAAAACKKVEKNDEFLRAIPSVTTSATLIKKDGSILPYTYPFITSTKSTATVALVGDTITIVGYLGGPDATIEVKVGDVIVPVFNRTQYESQISQTKEKTTLDFLQFVISKDLTTGNNIAVNITVNGRSIIAPSIIIGEFTDIPSSTDTTLVVEQIAEWLPASTAPYNGGNLWVAGTVTQNGNIYFLNAQGIFRINATGSLEQIIANGASITPDGGAAFTISSLVGMTVDIDEKVLYCSASVTEP
ncbi:MAG TPA: hypothetical protein VK541_13405, partial [Pedobacter sp.]|uniref:hypothetical protein n=1 Tax=Pedobacter sp. TaxID=1411316 RepID=UPI002B757DFF